MAEKILVVQGASYYRAIDGLGDFTSKVSEFMRNPGSFKLVMFTGGADVDPKFYGDTSPKGMCFTNPQRDVYEVAIHKMAVRHRILMTGICRGLQFLNIMAGGRMMHHIAGHESSVHDMVTNDGRLIPINSFHHQMIVPPLNALVLGCAKNNISSIYYGYADKKANWLGPEYEAAIFPKTKAFGVQYHPEMMSTTTEGYNYYYRMVECALKTDWNTFLKLYSGKSVNSKFSFVSNIPPTVKTHALSC